VPAPRHGGVLVEALACGGGRVGIGPPLRLAAPRGHLGILPWGHAWDRQASHPAIAVMGFEALAVPCADPS